MRKINKKAQLGLDDAPQIILIIGLVFLTMATLALISQKYGESFTRGESNAVNNETITTAELTAGGDTVRVDGNAFCNAGEFSATNVTNSSGIGTPAAIVGAGNYTFTSAGAFTNLTSEYVNDGFNVSYTNTYSGISCNITTDFEGEIESNTSIAGIILTISLVGIVLTVLISIFVGFRARRI